MEIGARGLSQGETRKSRTVHETGFSGKKKDSRTISALDAKLAAMQNLIYGVPRAKRNAKWC